MRAELQEIPIGACRFQHGGDVETQLAEDDRKLVHQRDVEIALRVLYHLR